MHPNNVSRLHVLMVYILVVKRSRKMALSVNVSTLALYETPFSGPRNGLIVILFGFKIYIYKISFMRHICIAFCLD